MWGKFASTSPRGAYIRRGNFNRWFFALRVWGAYTWRGLFSESYGILQKTVIGCPCVYCERFISHSDSMIKMLSGNKKIYFSDFNCTHGHMWPLMWKSSLWFAVFARIAMCMLCISCSNGSAIHEKKNCIRLNNLGYPWEKQLHLFTRLGLSMRKKFASVQTAWPIRAKKIVIHSNSLTYPFKTVIIVSRRFHLSGSRLGHSGRSHTTNLSKNVNTNLIQALC